MALHSGGVQASIVGELVAAIGKYPLKIIEVNKACKTLEYQFAKKRKNICICRRIYILSSINYSIYICIYIIYIYINIKYILSILVMSSYIA